MEHQRPVRRAALEGDEQPLRVPDRTPPVPLPQLAAHLGRLGSQLTEPGERLEPAQVLVLVGSECHAEMFAPRRVRRLLRMS